jgi:hypothetical protein
MSGLSMTVRRTSRKRIEEVLIVQRPGSVVEGGDGI